MSGGAFDYNQYKIGYIADEVEHLIEKNGREKTKEELKDERWRDPDWYKKYPEDLKHYEYPEEVIEKFKEGVKILRQAEIYAQRIDWLISGDDGEDNFLRRLKKDLENLSRYNKKQNLTLEK
jgi:hypothetical protein